RLREGLPLAEPAEPVAVGDHRDLHLQGGSAARRLQPFNGHRPVQLGHQPGAARRRQHHREAGYGARTMVTATETLLRPPGTRQLPTRVKEPVGDRIFLVGVYVLLTVFLVIVLLPLWYIVVSSVSSPEAVSAGRVFLWPVDFTWRGYETVLTNSKILLGFGNSVFYTVVGTAVSVTLTVMLAYPLSRANFVGGKFLTGAVVFTMLFAGGLIPTYLVVQELGLLDSRWALIVPKA